MKSFKAIYKFGNLYDSETKKRILIEDGTEISVILEKKKILPEDPNLKPKNLLDEIQKEKSINDFIDKEQSWKLFECGKLLYFEISAGVKRRDYIDPIKCLFQVRLLEDLYIYNKRKEAKYARFFECHCIVENCFNDFEFFEPIYATSLNDAYTKTYELYFAMFGKSTCNAFDRFSETPNMKMIIRTKTEMIQKKTEKTKFKS